MTALAAHELSTTFEWSHRVGLDERVSTPDGRVGRVIGFYCRTPETVLVHFDSGDSIEYAPDDLAPR